MRGRDLGLSGSGHATCQRRDPRSIADLTARPRFAELSSSVFTTVTPPPSPPGIPEALKLPEEQNYAAKKPGAAPCCLSNLELWPVPWPPALIQGGRMGTESRDECTQPGNCQDQDKGHFNGTVTECTQVQGLAPLSPTGSAWVCPWETKSIQGKGVFSFQTRKAAKPQHMPIPRPWPQQHSRLVALGHEVLSHLARPRLRAWPVQMRQEGSPAACRGSRGP